MKRVRYGTVPLWMAFPRRGEDPVTPRPPFPPFTEQTARQKVEAAEDAWNTPYPERVALAYTEDSVPRTAVSTARGRKPSTACRSRCAEVRGRLVGRAAVRGSGPRSGRNPNLVLELPSSASGSVPAG